VEEESRDEDGDRLGEKVRLQRELIRAQDKLHELVMEEEGNTARQVRHAHLHITVVEDSFIDINFTLIPCGKSLICKSLTEVYAIVWNLFSYKLNMYKD
jgi:hypothetical protein